MKQVIVISLFFVLFLSSCGGSNQNDLERAKQELLGNIPASEAVVDKADSQEDSSDQQERASENTQNSEQAQAFISAKNISENPIMKFDDLKIEDFASMEHPITGTIDGHIDKVTVLFSNPSSSMPNGEPYTLQKFTAGDKTFLYNAFKKYNALDYGLNTYEVTGYEGDTKHIIEIQIFIPKPELKTAENTTPVDMDTLPKGTSYGTPTKIGEGKVTYSDIKGLEVQNVGNIGLEKNSDLITDYLSATIDGWFYWNTARHISGEKGVSFYVVSKRGDGQDYIYEKHYYNGNGLYGIVSLDTGKLEGEATLQTENDILAERNDNYAITKISDQLFVDITK